MLSLLEKRALAWSHNPIPGFSLSTAGLLALADLSTVARRTALKGSASWLDILLLAPGMHNQQLADVLGSTTPLAAESLQTGLIYRLANKATIQYIWRVSKPGHLVVLDVRPRGAAKFRARPRYPAAPKDSLARSLEEENVQPSADILSTLLYLIGPALTVASLTLLGLTKDWWGLGLVFMMMASRALNIWIIQHRLTDTDDEEDGKGSGDPSEFVVYLGPDRAVQIRGCLNDLKAICGAWMRDKTAVEGYLEAMAKILVYMTAVFSGNVTQLGNIIILVLLVVSAAALALSNEYATNLEMHGRLTCVTTNAPTGPVTLSAAGLKVEIATNESQAFGPYPPPAKQDTGLSSHISDPTPWKGPTPQDTFEIREKQIEPGTRPDMNGNRPGRERRGQARETPPEIQSPGSNEYSSAQAVPPPERERRRQQQPYDAARRAYTNRRRNDSSATITNTRTPTFESDDFERRHPRAIIDNRFPFADDTSDLEKQ